MVKLIREEDLCSDDEIVLPYLRTDNDGLPVLRLVRTERGLDFALPSGEVIEYKDFRRELNKIGICTFQIKGVWEYDNPKDSFRLKHGQRLSTRREPENRYDPNAVALTMGRARTHIGYVTMGQSWRIARQLDVGRRLAGMILNVPHKHYPQALLTTPEILRHLQRH